MTGEFDWDGLDTVTCEAILANRWSEKERRLERELFATKWWDYRGEHPVKATYLFNDILNQELRTIIRAHVDDTPPRVLATGKVLDWNIVKSGDVFEPPYDIKRQPYWRRKTLGLIRARQQADRDGIPYPVFCREGLRFFYFGGGSYMLARAQFPEPNQLYGEQCLLHIRSRRLEQLDMKVQTAEHQRFRIVEAGVDPEADRHREWLVKQLETRPDPDRALVRLTREGFFLPADAERHARDVERFRSLLAVAR